MEDRSAEGISSRLALVAKLILLRLPVPELPQRFVGLESRRVQNDFWGEESKYEISERLGGIDLKAYAKNLKNSTEATFIETCRKDKDFLLWVDSLKGKKHGQYYSEKENKRDIDTKKGWVSYYSLI